MVYLHSKIHITIDTLYVFHSCYVTSATYILRDIMWRGLLPLCSIIVKRSQVHTGEQNEFHNSRQ